MGVENQTEHYPISLEDPSVQIGLAHVCVGNNVGEVAEHLFLYDKRPAAGYNDLLLLVQGEDDPRIEPLRKEGEEGVLFVFFGNTVEIGDPRAKATVRKVFALEYNNKHFHELELKLTDPWIHGKYLAVLLEAPERLQTRQKKLGGTTR